MSGTVRWTNESGKSTINHIQNEFGSHTLCGREVPRARKDWSLFGTPECKRCIKAQEKIDAELEAQYEEDDE